MPGKRLLRSVVPERVLELRADYLTTKKLVRTGDHYTGRKKNRMGITLTTLNRLLLPRRTISFYPEMPRPKAVIFDLCAYLNYKVVKGPSPHSDCEVLFSRSTYITPEHLRKDATDLDRTINGSCRDVSKLRVQECFKSVFGYALDLDPTRYAGQALMKSNLNHTHDGRIIATPIPGTEVDDRYVYQKVLNNEAEDSYFIDYRVPIYGQEIPLVYKKYRPPRTRFMDVSHAEIMAVQDIFSRQEIDLILEFCRLLRLDFGELDVLRDNDDQRIYIVDANNTPFHASIAEDTRKEALAILAPAFERLVTATASGHSLMSRRLTGRFQAN